MADIDIKVGSDQNNQTTGSQEYVFKLDARKTLDGDIIVRDHPDIDIVLMLKKGKIVAFPKDNLTDEVYLTQDKLFDFLNKRGVVSRDSVHGGNIHGSMEAELVTGEEGLNVNNICLMVLAKFIEEEKPYYDYMAQFEEELEQRLTEPSEEESSEFDPTRHKDIKGTLQPVYIRSPYGMSFTYRE